MSVDAAGRFSHASLASRPKQTRDINQTPNRPAPECEKAPQMQLAARLPGRCRRPRLLAAHCQLEDTVGSTTDTVARYVTTPAGLLLAHAGCWRSCCWYRSVVHEDLRRRGTSSSATAASAAAAAAPPLPLPRSGGISGRGQYQSAAAAPAAATG